MNTQIEKVKVVGFKRIKAVEIDLAPDDLTAIGGRNRQGKTSIADGVAWCLGGDKFKPSNPLNDESESLEITVILNDGTKARRAGKNAALTVTDSEGRKLNQSHLNEKVGAFALNLQKFMDAPAKEKADSLLLAIGIGDKLKEADAKIDSIYSDREIVGRRKLEKEKHAGALPEYKDAPAHKIIVSDLLDQQRTANGHNSENATKRMNYGRALERENRLAEEVKRLQAELDAKEAALLDMQAENAKQKAVIESLADVDVEEINAQIAASESVNSKVDANATKAAALAEAKTVKAEYDALTKSLEDARAARLALMEGVKMPLPEMSVEKGELLYRGQKWDCMSDSERIIVAISLARAINPECGFTTANRFEQLDIDTQNEVREWCKREGFQVLAARVSTNPEECTLIIEDGKVKDIDNAD